MKHLYIVTTLHDEEEIYIGFVPYRDIPKSSILFKALKRGELAYCNDSGVEGVYWDRRYAVEHIRLEKKFRKACGQTIKRQKITCI